MVSTWCRHRGATAPTEWEVGRDLHLGSRMNRRPADEHIPTARCSLRLEPDFECSRQTERFVRCYDHQAAASEVVGYNSFQQGPRVPVERGQWLVEQP